MLKFLQTTLLLCLLATMAIGGLAGWVWYELSTPFAHSAQNDTIEIARGESLDRILHDLTDRGILHNALPLRIYMKLKKQEMLVQAGNYSFPSPISALAVLTRLQQGGDFEKMTIIEGWTRWDIAEALCRLPSLKLKSKKDALTLLNDTSLIKDLDPKAQNLEGYLFPDTYFVVSNSTAKEIVRHAVDRFRQVWKEKLATRAKQLKISPRTIVTMASIIETEAKLPQERPLVASVIYNRLSRKIPLSMDSTIVYASKAAGAWRNDGKVYQSDIDRKSPYNTRMYGGLPPGPVGSPGQSSLEAALYPSRTPYLFYVRDPDRNDGAHTFYANAKSFEAGVQKLRAWEARQKQNR